ncbi:AfsR/SARP family transcriptional regulator [Amycolatopsis pithecellobii]|nr:winged helix-turn-helix domain-containing protein [Amycolatopsis pithecellobii]
MGTVHSTKLLRFGVFGGVEAIYAGEPLDLGRERDRCLLGLLLVNVNRVVTIDTLIQVFWGDRPPRSARSQLKNAVLRLRRALEGTGAALRTVGSGYELEVDPLSVDLHRAIHLGRRSQYEPSPVVAADLLEMAMSLWHSPVLGDIDNERAHEIVRCTIGPDLDALRQLSETQDMDRVA